MKWCKSRSNTKEVITLPISLANFVQIYKLYKYFYLSKPCYGGINRIALAENFQIDTHVSGFQSFSQVFASFHVYFNYLVINKY